MSTDKLSIGYFTAQFFPHMGGVEFYTIGLAKELTKLGHEVTIVTSEVKGEPDCSEYEGIPVWRLPSIQAMATRYPMLKPGRRFWKMIREMDKKKWDVVFVNTKFYPMSILGAWYAKSRKIPCIVVEHGSAHLRTAGKLTTWITEQAEHFYVLWIRLYKPSFVGVSKAACRWLKHFHIQALGPAYNTTDFEKIFRIQEKEYPSIREQYTIPKEQTLVLFAGRLLVQKGLIPLMEAVGKLAAEGEKIQLLVAGEGPLGEKVKQAGPAVVPLGPLSFEHLMQVEPECDIFCLPSETEGFPTALLEAAASHVYVMTTICGGIAEIVPDESYGYILKDNAAGTIYQALKEALQEPEKRKKAAEKLYEKVTKEFTFEQTAVAMAAYSRELIKKKAGGESHG